MDSKETKNIKTAYYYYLKIYKSTVPTTKVIQCK